MRALWNKLRARRGMTLVEMLAAALVLVLLGLMVHTGVAMARRGYERETAAAETRLLLATVSDRLATELRYARDVVPGPDGALESYPSSSYGLLTRLTVDEGTGRLLAGGKELLPAGAYSGGACRVTACAITYENSVFHVRLAVAGRMDVVSEAEFSVRCLSGTEDTSRAEEASL